MGTELFRLIKKEITEGKDNFSLKEVYRNKLGEILKKYAIEDKSNFGRLIDLGCTNPPTYDPDSDVLETIASEKNSATITAQQTAGAETLSKITLKLQNNEWLIKKKEILSHDDKWRRAPL
ncbi:NTF2 fold immunity protein [Pseudomonas syringae]|uniref:NTF2 fold immunity protein n=1 Tax=Pseudomonas syringae TaxID=317 RepID=UPI001E4471A6|nr:NTF2 fold immunity protein [Pseudomonas syringae]